MKNADVPVISFVAARSGTGKTTLLEKVVGILTAEGIRLAVIKHDAHRPDIDRPGKDTWRFMEAGAAVVAISSPEKVAVIEKVAAEKSLDEVIAMLPAVELILTEGFKLADKPKIEVRRVAVPAAPVCRPEDLLAVVSDEAEAEGVPWYHIDDAAGVADAVKRYMRGAGR